MCLDNIGYKKAFVAKGGDSGEIKTGVNEVGKDRAAFPVFSYRVNGVDYRAVGNVAYEYRVIKKRIGQDCTAYYDPQNPQRASLSKNSTLAVLGKIFVPIGVYLILFGISFLFMS